LSYPPKKLITNYQQRPSKLKDDQKREKITNQLEADRESKITCGEEEESPIPVQLVQEFREKLNINTSNKGI
jgi:hypothetical protein